jgi:hypothetical protein
MKCGVFNKNNIGEAVMSSLREQLQTRIQHQAMLNRVDLTQSFWYARHKKIQNLFTDPFVRTLNLEESELFFKLLGVKREFRLTSGVRQLRYYRGFFYVKALQPYADSGASFYYTWFRGERYEFHSIKELKKNVDLLSELGVEKFFLKKNQLFTDGFLVASLDSDAGLQRATCTVRDFDRYPLSIFTPMEVVDLHYNWLPISREDLEQIRKNPPPRNQKVEEAVRSLSLALQAQRHSCTPEEMAWRILRQKAASGRDCLYPLVWTSKPYELSPLLRGYVEAHGL